MKPRPGEHGTHELIRGLGPWAAASIVVGTTIGTGIFIVPGDMARAAGSVGIVMLAWIVGGALSLCGALSAAELAAALPEAGGGYIWVTRAFGSAWGFLGGWTNAMLGTPVSIATISAGLLRFIGFFFPALAAQITEWHGFRFTWAQPLAVLAIVIVTAINYLGVRLGGRIQVALTILKVGAILAVIVIAFAFGHGSAENLSTQSSTAAAPAVLAGLLTAMVGALWAYDGWVNVTQVASEVKNPDRNIPRALIGGVLLVCGMYIAISIASFFVLPFADLARSRLPVSDVLIHSTGPSAASWLTAVMIVCAAGTLNSSILTNARINYAMARQGLFFASQARVHPKFRTPGGALVFQAVMASLLALTGTFEDLYSLFIFASWIFYAIQTAALIRLRATEPLLPRPYRVWGYPWVPLLFIVGATALTVNLWIERPLRSTLGMALILAGLFFHAHWSAKAAPVKVPAS